MPKPRNWRKKRVARIQRSEGLTYEESGAEHVSRDKVIERAESPAREQRYAETKQGYDELVSYVASQNNISRERAVKRINRERALQAKAVLAAAADGRVRLTAAQQSRLTEISKGHYVNYKIERREAVSRYSRTYESRVAQEEKAAQFRQEVQQKRIRYNTEFRPHREESGPIPAYAGPVTDRPVERVSENPFKVLKERQGNEARSAVGQQSSGAAVSSVDRSPFKKENPFAKKPNESAAIPRPAASDRPVPKKSENPFAILKERENQREESPRVVSQGGLFGDSRTVYRERERQPEQTSMFRTSEVVQFGAGVRLNSLGQGAKLRLEREDRRTNEERERDNQREAEARTPGLL